MNPTLKKYLLIALKIAVSVSLLALVLSKAGVSNVIGLLKEMHLGYYALAVALHSLAIAVCSVRLWVLMGKALPLQKMLGLTYISSFFSVFMPGTVGGDALKVYYLYKETGQGVRSFAASFMDRYLGYLTIMAMGTVAYPFGYGAFRGTWVVWAMPSALGLFVVASAVFFWLRLGERFKLMADVYDAFDYYLKERSSMVRGFWVSMGVHALAVTSLYLITKGLGLEVPFWVLCGFYPIINTLAAVPLSVSGVGIRDAVIVLLFGALGIAAPQATAVSFAWFIAIALGSLPGLFVYIRYKAEMPKEG